ncbi:MAG: Two-component system sensor histidine kinase [uncultured Paraburkholderia sp.]|uniref:ATP-binding protein n=1 Tax=uncultured Paraburkholderia sp. TaxID=1822466 RepID=UPI00259246CD|nr:ATP-binding protein [uncultured Paraburkholderia sp.]CAH2904284.1 MAG: Two-component system sensor histidine kinase [uncultured Paraburkholderia sp.]CAH2943157.1 MAG: Two-component system sensor histidine kinase [uncultured Paraburkholderia sp.]
MTSIRRWLLGWLIAGLGAAVLTAGYGIFHTARSEASELFDYELRTVALSLPASLTDGKSLEHRGPDFEDLAEDRLFIQIWGSAETPVYTSLGGIGLPRFPAGIRTIERQEVHWRVFGSRQGDRFVQVAQPVSVRNDLALRLALRTLWPLGVFFPAIILIVLVVVGRALSPLERISHALAARSLNSLAPLHLDRRSPVELEPLVNALNDLLNRLDIASRAQRTFVADAAHELRSPLAALKLQIQGAERDGSLTSSGTFERIKGRLDRMIHLVHQLLILAREDAPRADQFEVVSLRGLAERAVADASFLAGAKQIDLGLEFADPLLAVDPFNVHAETAGIEVLLDNVIDNAIRYTPEHGKVDVVLARSGAEVSITVVDSGPGIPEAELDRVCDRFYRSVGTKEQGSGLGLAIAARIALRHNAMLSLKNNKPGLGLSVVLTGLRSADKR